MKVIVSRLIPFVSVSFIAGNRLSVCISALENYEKEKMDEIWKNHKLASLVVPKKFGKNMTLSEF